MPEDKQTSQQRPSAEPCGSKFSPPQPPGTAPGCGSSAAPGSSPGAPPPHDSTPPPGTGRPGCREKVEFASEQLREAARRVVDGVLRRMPPDVVEHLNNSRKELLLAARSLIDRELDSIDRTTQRARDLHQPSPSKDDSRGAASGGGAN